MADDATEKRLNEAAKCLKKAARQVSEAIAAESTEHFAYHVNDAIAQCTFALSALQAAKAS